MEERTGVVEGSEAYCAPYRTKYRLAELCLQLAEYIGTSVHASRRHVVGRQDKHFGELTAHCTAVIDLGMASVLLIYSLHFNG